MSEHYKIVYLITRADTFGGAQIHVKDLAHYMICRGHDVTVLVGGTGPYTERLAEAGVPYRSLKHLGNPINPFRDILALFEIRKHLRQIKPDLVSCHSTKSGWLGRPAAWSLGIPVIFTAHGWSFTDGVPNRTVQICRRIERFAACFCDRIINVSEDARQLAVRYRVAPDNKLLTIHNGMPDVSPDLLADPTRQPPKLVKVARFDEPKDHAMLLRVLAELKDMAWSLDLVGDGPRVGEIQHLASELGIADRVNILGRRTDVDAILAESQLFLLLSKWEGFPRSILEAMRAGLPVIASDVGGVRESVTDGTNGYLIPRGDSIALRARLKHLLENPEERSRMGSAGRQRYEAEFAFSAMQAKTVAVYREVLAKHNHME